ncbi:hypothetical protein A9Q99_10090 [Gammaproteobacteria bacterium 45_16_T64]|nr:hypothetical protein A9Q99_10090 [Gammaproteobacteria bacterium 45_16_T64]
MSKEIWLDESPATSRRERRKQEFREKIIESAIMLFEKNGCDATTLEDICDIAEISRPTFYSYYASKQELIDALGQKLWLNVIKELTSESLAKHESTQQYIQSFLELTRREIVKYSRLEKELIRQIMSNDPGDSRTANILNGMTSMLMSIYSQGKKKGDIGNRYPVDFLAEMTMGSISSVMMNWALDPDFPIEKRLKQLADYIPSMLELNK